MQRFGQKAHGPAVGTTERNWSAGEVAFSVFASRSSIIMWMVQPDGASIYVNQAWCDFTGLSREETLGAGWVQNVHPDDRSSVELHYAEALRLQGPFDLEYRLLRADGSFVWVLSSGQPYFGEHGQHVAYTGAVRTFETLRLRLAHPISVTAVKLLTRREAEILEWIAKGNTSDEIAMMLGTSPRTVETHCKSAAVKLGAINRVQAVVEAIRQGEIPF